MTGWTRWLSAVGNNSHWKHPQCWSLYSANLSTSGIGQSMIAYPRFCVFVPCPFYYDWWTKNAHRDLEWQSHHYHCHHHWHFTTDSEVIFILPYDSSKGSYTTESPTIWESASLRRNLTQMPDWTLIAWWSALVIRWWFVFSLANSLVFMIDRIASEILSPPWKLVSKGISISRSPTPRCNMS